MSVRGAFRVGAKTASLVGATELRGSVRRSFAGSVRDAFGVGARRLRWSVRRGFAMSVRSGCVSRSEVRQGWCEVLRRVSAVR